MMNMNAHNINILRYLLRKWTLKQLLISVIVFYTSSCLLEHYVLNQYFPQFISDQVQDSLNEVSHSPTLFRMNYAEMEREFKVFVYQDRNITKHCDLPNEHNSKYESEEYFFSNLKMSPFLTDDAEEAHLFFIPIFSQKMMKKAAENIPFLEKNTARPMCSSSYDSKYIPHKDVAFQQIKEQSLPSDGDKG